MKNTGRSCELCSGGRDNESGKLNMNDNKNGKARRRESVRQVKENINGVSWTNNYLLMFCNWEVSKWVRENIKKCKWRWKLKFRIKWVEKRALALPLAASSLPIHYSEVSQCFHPSDVEQKFLCKGLFWFVLKIFITINL